MPVPKRKWKNTVLCFFSSTRKSTRSNAPCKKEVPQAMYCCCCLFCFIFQLATEHSQCAQDCLYLKFKTKIKKGGGGIRANPGHVFLLCKHTVLTTVQRRKGSQSPTALYKNMADESLHWCTLTQVVLWQRLLSALCTDSTLKRRLALIYNQKLPLLQW